MGWLSKLWRAKPQEAPLSEIRASFDQSALDDKGFPEAVDPRLYHVKFLANALGDLNGKRAIDVGSGKGRFARVLLERNPAVQLTALDLSEAMLAYIKPPLQPVSASMTQLPFADNTFDGAYAIESLEHAVHIEVAVAELCRIVKPGGKIVIIDKNVEKWGRFKTPRWEKWFKREELENLLRQHCQQASSELIAYWEDEEPDGVFVGWTATR